MTSDRWDDAESYERYVGRWSRPVARGFVRRMSIVAGARWLDVGCGTGAPSATTLTEAAPAMVIGVDRAAGYVAHANETMGGTHFETMPPSTPSCRDSSSTSCPTPSGSSWRRNA